MAINPSFNPVSATFPTFQDSCERQVWKQIWGLITSDANIIACMGPNPCVRDMMSQTDDIYPRINVKLDLKARKKAPTLVRGHVYFEIWISGPNEVQALIIEDCLKGIFNNTLMLDPTPASVGFHFNFVDNFPVAVRNESVWHRTVTLGISGTDRRATLRSVNRYNSPWPV